MCISVGMYIHSDIYVYVCVYRYTHILYICRERDRAT